MLMFMLTLMLILACNKLISCYLKFHCRLLQSKTDENQGRRFDAINKENEANGRIKVSQKYHPKL